MSAVQHFLFGIFLNSELLLSSLCFYYSAMVAKISMHQGSCFHEKTNICTTSHRAWIASKDATEAASNDPWLTATSLDSTINVRSLSLVGILDFDTPRVCSKTDSRWKAVIEIYSRTSPQSSPLRKCTNIAKRALNWRGLCGAQTVSLKNLPIVNWLYQRNDCLVLSKACEILQSQFISAIMLKFCVLTGDYRRWLLGVYRSVGHRLAGMV